MKVYKLTDQDGYTRRGEKGETKWGEGVTHEAVGEGAKLCTSGVIHYYDDPALALFVCLVHTNFANPLVWEAEIQESVARDGLKGGAKRLTTLHVIDTPKPTSEQCVAFGILCSLEVSQHEGFRQWARCWLDGSDRSYKSAVEMASTVAPAAAMVAAEAAMWLAEARGERTLEVIRAAAAAVVFTMAVKKTINFPAIARKAMEVI